MFSLSRKKKETWDTEKAEVLNEFFPQLSPASDPNTLPEMQKAKGSNRENVEPLTVVEHQVQDHLRNPRPDERTGRIRG